MCAKPILAVHHTFLMDITVALRVNKTERILIVAAITNVTFLVNFTFSKIASM